MKNLIIFIALVTCLCAAPRIAEADRNRDYLNIAQSKEMAQQKKQDAELKAIEDEAAKLLEETNMNTGKPNKKAQ
jgi:hypothetical protein